jgi:hypothetical protein
MDSITAAGVGIEAATATPATAGDRPAVETEEQAAALNVTYPHATPRRAGASAGTNAFTPDRAACKMH